MQAQVLAALVWAAAQRLYLAWGEAEEEPLLPAASAIRPNELFHVA